MRKDMVLCMAVLCALSAQGSVFAANGEYSETDEMSEYVLDDIIVTASRTEQS